KHVVDARTAPPILPAAPWGLQAPGAVSRGCSRQPHAGANRCGKPFAPTKHMPLHTEKKTDLIKKFRTHESDTGSPDVQIALITQRIASFTEPFKTHVKDHHSRRGLLRLVSKRRRLLDYLKKTSLDRYRKTVAALNLRK